MCMIFVDIENNPFKSTGSFFTFRCSVGTYYYMCGPITFSIKNDNTNRCCMIITSCAIMKNYWYDSISSWNLI